MGLGLTIIDSNICVAVTEGLLAPKHFRIMERKYLSDFNLITLDNGMKFRIPQEVRNYLVYRYGKAWNVPQTEKGDWQDDCGDLERIL